MAAEPLDGVTVESIRHCSRVDDLRQTGAFNSSFASSLYSDLSPTPILTALTG
jgi:hypothetical protein